MVQADRDFLKKSVFFAADQSFMVGIRDYTAFLIMVLHHCAVHMYDVLHLSAVLGSIYLS